MKKEIKKIIKKGAVLVFLFSFLTSPVLVEAAMISLNPSYSEHRKGDSFIIDIQLETGGECINAVEVSLDFPHQIITGEDFNKGRSVLELWPEGPEIKNNIGEVYFSGGIPGGYCPESDYDPVSLGEIVFRNDGKDRRITERISLLSARVFLDDGTGSYFEPRKEDAYIVSYPEEARIKKDPWREIIESDDTPPKSFTPEIRKERFIHDGKYVLIFFTTDKETGVDRYLVSEQKRVGFIKIQRENWQEATSPHLLRDQNLRSVIKVKAIDKAGNVRLEEIHPPYGWQDVAPWILVVIIALVIVIKKKKRKEMKIKWH